MANSIDWSQQIVISGLPEMYGHIRSGEIGAVITASEPDMLEYYKQKDPEHLAHASAMLAQINEAQIPHYYSRVFHQDAVTRAEIKTRLASIKDARIRAETRAAIAFEAVSETVQVAEKMLKVVYPKKVAIHCLRGVDRSAMLGLLLLIKNAGGPDHVDEALMRLREIRPNARLAVGRDPFRLYMGQGFEKFAEAVGEFRDAVTTTKSLREEFGAAGLIANTDTSSHIFLIDAVPEPQRPKIVERVARYNGAARRFRLPTYGIKTI